MPLIIPTGFAHAVHRLKLNTDPEEMVTTMGLDISAYGSDHEGAADRAFICFQANVLPMISNQYEFLGVTLYVGVTGGQPLVVDSTNPAATGGDSEPPLPQNCAWLLRKRTGSSGRRGRGRCYIPGISEEYVSPNGTIGSTFLANFQTAADEWYTDLVNGIVGGFPIPPVVLHRSEGIGAEPAPTPVTLFAVESVIATQRRRMRK